MQYGAILKAAGEILADLEGADRPADGTLRQWARANRYAGSKDRARIAETVYGVLRRRSEYAWHMKADTPRALVLAHQTLGLGVDVGALEEACDGQAYNEAPLTADERQCLGKTLDPDSPAHIAGNYPEWLSSAFDPRHSGFEAHKAMAARAPLDLRANTLKSTRDAVFGAIRTHLNSLPDTRRPALLPASFSPAGLRLRPPPGGGALPDLTTLEAFKSGAFEIQDEGSQLVSFLAGARPGDFVIELCAGGGGKTLALAAAMGNEGRLLACDTDSARLASGEARAGRAGVTIAEHRHLSDGQPLPGAPDPDFADIGEGADLVFLDVPCSGSGTWRRMPETKWRLTHDHLERLTRVQTAILERGAGLTKKGGRLVYVTCSILRAENTDRIGPFLQHHPDFVLENAPSLWAERFDVLPQIGLSSPGDGVPDTVNRSLLLSPYDTQTDGFFFASLKRTA